MERFAIVGLGCAGCHAIEAIRETNREARIHVYSDTALPPYNPMLTTYYVAGRLPYEGLFPFGSLEEIARRLDVTIHTQERVVSVKARERKLVLSDGREESYDKILISTGATAFVPGSFAGLKRAFCMRTVDDAVALHDALEKREYKDAVIVGASMVGIKVAELLYKRGCHVTLADMAPHIFALAAYPEVSGMIEDRLRRMGIDLTFGQAIAGAEENNDGTTTVKLADGSSIDTELLVLNIGTRAATGLVNPDEVAVERGIVVNDHMETSVPGIYAAGDCCQGNNLQSGQTQIIGLWANAGTQGRAAGRNMAGAMGESDGNILHNITHFLDMDFIGLGDNRLTGEVKTFRSPDGRFYLQAVIRDGKPVGFNILDNYGVSGILKAYLIKVLRGERPVFSSQQRVQLIRFGLSENFIDELGEAL